MIKEILWQDPVFEKLKAGLDDSQGPFLVSGLTDSAKCHLCAAYHQTSPKKKYQIIVTADENHAQKWMEQYRFYDENIFYFPAKDPLFYSADVHGNAIAKKRLECMERIMKGQGGTFVVTIDALMERVIPLKEVKNHVLKLKTGDEVEEASLSAALVTAGYEKASFVEAPGEFAVRGGIVDVYPLTAECPYRIEFWGEEIESIRSFDKESQRSIEKVDHLAVYPAVEMILDDEKIAVGINRIQKEYKQAADTFHEAFETEKEVRLRKEFQRINEELSQLHMLMGGEGYLPFFYENLGSMLDYFPDHAEVYLDEPAHIKERGEGFYLEFRQSMESRLENGYLLPGQMATVTDFSAALTRLHAHPVICLSSLTSQAEFLNIEQTFFMETKDIQSYRNSFEMLVKDLKRYKKKEYKIILIAPSIMRAKRLTEDLREHDITVTYDKKLEMDPMKGQMVCGPGKCIAGVEYPLLKWVLIAESDIFTGHKKKRSRKMAGHQQGEKIKDFSDISIGDYVVHEKHGVGIYRGIEKIRVDKVEKDYISIEYKGGDKLFILASALNQISKYSSAKGRRPMQNRLGGEQWKKTTRRVRAQVGETAKELVDLYALRQAKEGYIYSKDTIWQKEFEELFPYEETKDQLNAIADVKSDMEQGKIMDRLICGDVGYGKTEVAIRAAFKAVTNGKQVAYLVPTTILAQQHYHTFFQRMKDYPMTVRMMSRFCSPKEQKETREGLKKGLVDVVIGTHRLLSKDVAYKDLGLLIIDEEQRFGVGHKEKIKQLKKDVNVLSLSATPIPRTLHMSLIGIRDMSLLEEPPHDRRAIQTYVMEYNEEMVKEAVHRELVRGGQVYYVYNRINYIADITAQLQKMMPDVRVKFAHGQMPERELEDIMQQFLEREIDVLVSTTIIETGLDIPNVNTMIIHDANQLGLSQLYQLRGRVGRSNRNAFAFLMYQKNTLLKETAEKRLQAIREFTDLGSGYKIAMRDLEIRGAGNLLGKSQSGHMEAVGYDLYCKMLNDAVRRLKGEAVEESEFDTSVDMDVDAFIPAVYVKSEVQKLDLYKRISAIESEEELEDMENELGDRFGPVPTPVKNLLHIALMKALAHRAFITEMKQKGERIYFQMKSDAKVKVDDIEKIIINFPGHLSIQAGENPTFVLNLEDEKKGNWIKKTELCVKSLNLLIME